MCVNFFFVSATPNLILCTVAEYNHKFMTRCMKEDNPGQKYIKGDKIVQAG